MSVLSVVRGGDKVVPAMIANSLCLTSPVRIQSGAEVTFEIFESNSGSLRFYIGRREFYALDDNAFWGELKCLDPCVSTIYKLPALRDRSTLRGVLSILGEIPTDRRLLSYYLNLNA
jgi:hypothetical protein